MIRKNRGKKGTAEWKKKYLNINMRKTVKAEREKIKRRRREM